MIDQRKNVIIKTGQNGLSTVFGHDFMKTRVVLVANTATVAKAVNNPVLDLAKDADVLGKHRNIVRGSAACQ